MKRFTMTMALLLAVAMPMMAERVTPETARKVATTFLQNNGAKTTQMAELSKSVGFDNLYIFTTESSFVVMSADDCVKPILGYSFDGRFEVEGMPENVRGWLKGYNEEIAFAVQNDMKATSETALLWKDFVEGNTKAGKAIVAVNPLIQTKWNQNKYYNNLCPAVSGGPNGHAYTGCVATAMAQIMKYWGYPSHGIGSNSYTWNGRTLSANFGATTYDWDNMNPYYEYYYENGEDPNSNVLPNPTEEEINAIATLMYHCGVSVEMNYGGGSSNASTSHVADALKNYFNYSSDIEYRVKTNFSDEEWKTMVKNELNSNRPLQYRGSSTEGGGGHSFICDGYNDNDYFHFNWGWSGKCDGYFSLDNLNTGANNQSGQGHGVYTNDQAALFGIQPTQCLAEAPTNLAYTLSGLQNITLNWATANGAVSYNIYRNGNLVDNTTATAFTETAPFGTNVYWVRSVDTNGELSLASNTITITIAYQTPVVNDLEATLLGNEATLSWTAPDWCYPETPSSTLTYGTQNNSGTYYPFGSVLMYWGQRYLSENLLSYNGLRLYSVDFYTHNPGTYELCIYTGSTTNNEQARPSTLVYSQSILATAAGWNTIDLSSPYIINGAQDLWVFIHNTDIIENLQVYLCTADGAEGVYLSEDPLSYTFNNANGFAFMIKSYLTDGTYTYNLYQDGVSIANNLTQTSYSDVALNNNATNLFSVKTNYYAGETDASNKIGFAKGSSSLNDWEMAANDKMTLTENSKLTVSGTFSNNDPEHLILENGAQLIHNTEGVKATVKKSITAYTGDDNGWHFIASPVTETITPCAENGFLNGTVGQGNNTYDLYYFYEPEHLWKNYERQTFDIEYKKGYLYANGETSGTTLEFTGTLLPSDTDVTIYDLSREASELNGFNLVGNPFACNATIGQDCYVIDGNQAVLATTAPVLAPCESVMVKATNENSSVTFTKATSAKGTSSKDCFDLVVTQGKANVDRARVRLGEGNGMEKFSLDDKHTQISLWQDGKNHAVAYTNGAKELPLNFKAKKNGTYTLAIEAENLNLDYLHLIDNLTGDNTDLLSTPNYTFEAKTTDFASRFRLVFSNCEDAVGDNETFAYISNGNIIVNNEDNATLHIVDATGRMVASYDGRIQCIPTSGMASGVYVLRLINDNSMKTQKLIIE